MAFLLPQWSRQSVALNTGEVTAGGVVYGGPAMFSYRSAADAVATIVAANYFADAVYDLSVDDLIYIVGSDAVGMYVVATVSRSAGTITLTAAFLTGTVETANIAAGAVLNAQVGAAAAIAFSKLEVMTSGNIMVGSAANVATEVTMSGDATIIASGAISIGTDKVTSAMIKEDVLKYAAVTMSSVEFAGAYAAPHLLVAAAGANTLLVLESAQVLMTYVTTQYANGGVAHIQYDSTGNGAGIIASTTQIAADFADAASTANGFNQGIVKQPFTTCVNKGLYFSNITGAFDTGDSTFVVHIWYREVPTV